jgi:membrane-associated phospholipid phosphatase
MPTVVTVYLATYIYLQEKKLLIALKAFAINLFAAPLFYLWLRVCGPQYAFSQFPRSAGPVVAHLILLNAAPNGFPSVHTSTALLILLLAWRWRGGIALGSVYLGLIVMSTLASGQHYLFDLLAAVPYAFAVAKIAGVSMSGNRRPLVLERTHKMENIGAPRPGIDGGHGLHLLAGGGPSISTPLL